MSSRRVACRHRLHPADHSLRASQVVRDETYFKTGGQRIAQVIVYLQAPETEVTPCVAALKANPAKIQSTGTRIELLPTRREYFRKYQAVPPSHAV